MALKTIFLDRDGVINKEINYLHKISEFEFIDGIFDACKSFKDLGYQIIIITNQSGIGQGFYTESEYYELTQWMLEKFLSNKIAILDVFHCPHVQNSKCECRKPKPGLFKLAQEKYNLNFDNSWMIGDKESDVIAANGAGINKTILLRSGHKIDEESSNATFIENSIIDSLKIIIN